jgi:hypothetical protein
VKPSHPSEARRVLVSHLLESDHLARSELLSHDGGVRSELLRKSTNACGRRAGGARTGERWGFGCARSRVETDQRRGASDLLGLAHLGAGDA